MDRRTPGIFTPGGEGRELAEFPFPQPAKRNVAVTPKKKKRENGTWIRCHRPANLIA